MTARRRVPAEPVSPHTDAARPVPRGGGSNWDSSPFVRVVGDNPDEQLAACRAIAIRYAAAVAEAGGSVRQCRAAAAEHRVLLDALGLLDVAAELAARHRHPAGKRPNRSGDDT